MKARVCKTCAYWAHAVDDALTADGVDVRTCNHTMVCRPTYGPNSTMTSAGVLTMDEGGYTGELCTGPEFGCCHYESL